MIAKDLISQNIPPLKITDTGQKALNWMMDFHVRHLPIVEDDRFFGIVSEDDILDYNEALKPIQEHPVSERNGVINANDHLLEVLRKAAESQFTVLAVVDDQNQYLGGITLDSLLGGLAQSASIAIPGSILLLEVPKRDYSLSQIARIAESENAIIVSTLITSRADSDVLELTLKLNTRRVQPLVETYSRFGFVVKALSQESDYSDTFRDRFDALMAYLNI